MEYEDTVRIATPEGVEIELALAGIGSRLAARLIDHLLQAAGAVGALLLILPVAEGEGFAEALVAVLGIVLTFLVFWAYDVLFEAFNSGRTPGKRALGLRVVGDRGEPVSFSMAAIRNVLRVIDEYLTVWIAALVSMVRSQRTQRLGGLAAGTLVVKDRADAQAADAGLSLGSLDQLEAAASWDTTQVGDADLPAPPRFLQPRYQLDPQARVRLAHQLAGRLRPKVRGSESTAGAEQFVELLVAVRSRRG